MTPVDLEAARKLAREAQERANEHRNGHAAGVEWVDGAEEYAQIARADVPDLAALVTRMAEELEGLRFADERAKSAVMEVERLRECAKISTKAIEVSEGARRLGDEALGNLRAGYDAMADKYNAVCAVAPPSGGSIAERICTQRDALASKIERLARELDKTLAEVARTKPVIVAAREYNRDPIDCGRLREAVDTLERVEALL